MFKFFRDFFFHQYTAWYSRPHFRFRFIDGSMETYTPLLFHVTCDTKPSHYWRLWEDDGMICDRYSLAAIKEVEVIEWDDYKIKHTCHCLDLPSRECEEDILNYYKGKKYILAEEQ